MSSSNPRKDISRGLEQWRKWRRGAIEMLVKEDPSSVADSAAPEILLRAQAIIDALVSAEEDEKRSGASDRQETKKKKKR